MIDQEISRRMDAYRGNPQALMQRYQQSQQLIDLLALQKLKSEKEAAVRSMQMAAGQQQQPTVAQQREQEVMGLTQQEVAQQVGQVAQQRAAKEREAMQRLMGGIAAAPGAENAMPPQAMAAGGIVAFQAGGDVADMPPVEALGGDVDEIRKRLAEARRKLLTYGTRQQKADPEGYAQAKRDVEDLTSRERSVGRRYEQQYGGGIYRPPNAPLTTRNFPVPEAAASRSVGPVGGDLTEQSIEEVLGRAGPQTPAAPPAAPAAPAPAPAPTPEPMMMGPPPPEAPQAGLPAALPRAPDELRSALMGMLNPDLQAAIAQRQGMIPGMNPERLAARQKAIDERQRMYEQEFDPKRQAMQKLIAFLSAGGGRTTTAGALGAGAQGYAQASAAQRAAQRERFGELERMREGVRSLEEARELEQSKAGLGALSDVQRGQQIATSGLTGLTSAEIQAQTSRENAQLQARTAATQEQGRALERDINRKAIADRDAERQYGILTQRRDKEYQDALADFDKQNDMLAMQVQFVQRKPNPTLEEIRLINDYERRRVAAGRAAVAQTDQVLARIAARLNVPEPTRAAPSSGMDLSSAATAELLKRGVK